MSEQREESKNLSAIESRSADLQEGSQAQKGTPKKEAGKKAAIIDRPSYYPLTQWLPDVNTAIGIAALFCD